ncbi:MAG: MFS transporter [Dehalococcoidia bacterium]|nr:MFS transporter [Dehalococcoidia bacterium]
MAAASCFMMFFASGIFFRGFSVFFVPLRDSLNLSNFQTSLVFSISRAEGGLEGPAAGYLIDKFGNRILAVLGIIIAGVGYLIFARVDNFIAFALVYLGMISLGASVSFQHAIFAGLNMWFIRNRALALSLLASSAALGGVVLIPLLTLFIARAGWEWASFISGLVFLVVVLPFTLVIKTSPESMGLLPDGDTPASGSSTARNRETPRPGPVVDARDFSISEALHTGTYWLLLLGMVLRQLAIMGILVNLQPLLIWKGASLETAGYLIALMLATNVVARIAIGWAADRWPKPPIMTLCSAAGSLACVLILLGSWDTSPWAIVLYLVLTGIGESVGIIGWAALGDYYGRRKFASLRGIITFSQSGVLVGSPMFVGWWADHTGGSYAFPLLLCLIFIGTAAVCFALMRKPTRRSSEG